jgi:hypothetical protein
MKRMLLWAAWVVLAGLSWILLRALLIPLHVTGIAIANAQESLEHELGIRQHPHCPDEM